MTAEHKASPVGEADARQPSFEASPYQARASRFEASPYRARASRKLTCVG